MARGVHHHHEVKSESDVERVWVSLDSEGNELGYHVEPLGTTQSIPLAEHLGPLTLGPSATFTGTTTIPTQVGPVRVNHRLGRQTVISFVAGCAGAGLLELAIHLR